MRTTRLYWLLVLAYVPIQCLGSNPTINRLGDTPYARDIVRRVYRPDTLGAVITALGKKLEAGNINVNSLIQDMNQLQQYDQQIQAYLTDRNKQKELAEAQKKRNELENRVQRNGFQLLNQNDAWPQVYKKLTDSGINIAWNSAGNYKKDGTLNKFRELALQVPGVTAADINRSFPNGTPSHLLNNDDPSQLRGYRAANVVEAVRHTLEAMDDLTGSNRETADALAALQFLTGTVTAHDFDVLREIIESPASIRNAALHNMETFKEWFEGVVFHVANRGRSGANRFNPNDPNALRNIFEHFQNNPQFKTEVAHRFYLRLRSRFGEPIAKRLCSCLGSKCKVPPASGTQTTAVPQATPPTTVVPNTPTHTPPPAFTIN